MTDIISHASDEFPDVLKITGVRFIIFLNSLEALGYKLKASN